MIRRISDLVALATLGILLTAGLGMARSPATPPATRSASDSRYYDMGSPGPFVELYVSPTGDDTNGGAAADSPLRTMTAAWGRIPATLATAGYRINLLPGTYLCEPGEPDNCINYFSDRAGSFQHPIVIRAANGAGTAILRGGLNVRNVRYLYLLDLNLVGGGTLPTNSSGNNLLHLDGGDHVLLRGISVVGPSCANDTCNNLQEVLKVNQSQYLYVEDSTIGGAWHSSVDYMVVQYGHFLNNRVHTAGQWCMYVKGGSAYLRIEGNELYGCQLGFQAGQSANLAVMRSPWFHYEAYDIKFVNNVLHDIPGVGLSVSGAYNALLAYNTLYRVATSTDNGYPLLQFVQGERACSATDDIPNPVANCSTLLQQGGWGPDYQTEPVAAIANRNVYVHNNILYNPSPSRTLYSHFSANAPLTPPAGLRNVPSPSRSDDNLVIAGNLIWNGPTDHPLGVGNAGEGCAAANPSCNPAQLVVSNTINLVQPQLVNPGQGDYRPVVASNVFSATTYPAPDFAWSDAPAAPAVPAGSLANAVSVDRAGNQRPAGSPPGAYASFTGTPAARTHATYLPVAAKGHAGGW